MSTFERMLNVLGDRFGNETNLNDTNLVAKLLRSSDQPRRNRARRRRAKAVSGMGAQAERLEPRLALAVTVTTNPVSNWLFLLADDVDSAGTRTGVTDDIYISQVATVPQSLLVSNNSGFQNNQAFSRAATAVPSIDSYSGVYVAQALSGSVQNKVNEGYPFNTGRAYSDGSFSEAFQPNTTTHLLRYNGGTANFGDTFKGQVTNGLGDSWNFTWVGGDRHPLPTPQTFAGTFVFTPVGVPDPSRPAPTFGYPHHWVGFYGARAGGGQTSVAITWDSKAAETKDFSPVITSVEYGSDNLSIGTGHTIYSDYNVMPSAGSQPAFQLPRPAESVGKVLASLKGTVKTNSYGSFAFTLDADPVTGNSTSTGIPYTANQPVPCIFSPGTANPYEAVIKAEYSTRTLTGYFDQVSQQIKLEFKTNYAASGVSGNGYGGTSGPYFQDIGSVKVDVTFADYLGEGRASRFEVSPGLDVTRQMRVDMTIPGSSIVVSSPVVVASSGQIGFHASNVVVNAKLDAGSRLNINQPIVGNALAEEVIFNAEVTAPIYDIRVSDDPGTAATRRGRVFITSSGSLTGAAGAASGSIYMQADVSDVYVEGVINVSQQSYLFRSPGDSEPLSPFVFTTISPRSGVNTGLLQGNTVTVTLANDSKTPEQQSVASNIVDLRTRIDSLRITAASRKGDPISGPFPYDLAISEQGDISFDAVASSGRSISLAAGGSIGFTSALSTWGDLSITAGGNFNVTAPMSAARGKIAIVADDLTVSNSVRVLDSVADATRDDITLTSTAGDLGLTGAIAAVNNIRLVQRNAAGRPGSISGPSRIIANGINVEAEGSAILKTDAVTLSGRAAGDFMVDELNDITITSLRAPGVVTLLAGGTDPGLNNAFTPNPIALTARLYDVVSLEASAPRGSIDIVTDTSKTLVLGNGATQTIAGPVVVTDAPARVGSSIPVRVKTVKDLEASSYSQGVLGQWASTLTGGFDNLTGSYATLSVDNVSLATGDRILVANQTNSRENGLYVVTFSGSAGSGATSGGTTTSGSIGRPWVLTRAPNAETPATLAQGLFVQVIEGTEAGRSFIVRYDRESALAASSMQAAGAVSIRSLAGPLIVADAPVGGGSAITVRVATTDDLGATLYTQGAPGRVASTLTGSTTALIIGGIPLRVGDRILVANQTNANENGVYSVTVSGSLGRKWVLSRAPEADTSAELADGSYVRELEGANAGSVYVMKYDRDYGESPLVVSTVSNRAGAEAVRVATTVTLPGTYDFASGTIKGAGVMPPLVDGVALAVGDRVLVRLGTQDALPGGTGVTPLPVSVANGVYVVAPSEEPDGTEYWVLKRASNIDTLDPIETGYVITTEGSYRATATGQAFALSYESLGIDPLVVTPLASSELVTNVGTEDFNDLTTFVVSSTAGSNNAAGSLGKMISLRQSLDTSSSSLNGTPKVDFAFSSVLPGGNGGTAGVIRLTQELPTISKAFAINGANRFRLPGETGLAVASITIDGSRITTTRTDQPAAGAAEVNGIEFVNGSQSTVGMAGGSVANLTIGGFANGSAVKINGVEGILVNKVVLGRSETGDRLINKFGVRATRAGAEGTVSGSTIVGSTQAGIRTDIDAAGLTIVGTTVGALNQGNGDGIQLDGGTSRVGLTATVDTKSFIQTVSGQNAFSLPPAISPRNLHLGQGVSGPGIAGGSTVAAINGSIITLSKAMTATARTKGIRFSSPARNTVQFNLSGMVLSGGNNIVSSTDVGKNAYDGIRATGGIQTIGTAKKVNNVSNGIYGNGRSGVVIEGAPQIIVQGNYLGLKGKNQLANIVVNGVAQPAPKVKTRLDANGNFHALVR